MGDMEEKKDPQIRKIPYETAEDLNYFLYDNYNSTENLTINLLRTGALINYLFQLELNTGVTQNSFSQIFYNTPSFNPLYGEATWKMRMKSKKDCFAFFGFKETTSTPTFNMTESHAGFMINDHKLYASVADGDNQQKVEIIGIDVERVENYRIEYNKFSIMPLPMVEQQLSLPYILSVNRVWKEYTTLSNYPPENQAHYIMHYIENETNEEKYIRFNRFIYREVYAD